MTHAMDWEQFFKQAPAPLLVLDRALRISAASDLYLQTVQRRLEDIKGQYVFDAFPENGERLAMFDAAFQAALGGEANALTEVAYSIPVVNDDGAFTGETKLVWWTCHHNPIIESDGEIRYMVQKAQDVTKQVMAEQLKDAIAKELQHRIGNIFSLVSAVVRRTVENSDDFDQFLSKFDGRLMALHRTHKYLTGDHWDGMTIDQIIDRELADFKDSARRRVTVDGGPIQLDPTEAQIFTLAIHELATNSIKYGALNGSDGRLNISWSRAGVEGFDFEWKESDIQIGSAPSRKGFGSYILDKVVPAQLRADASRNFGSGQFAYNLSVRNRAQAL